MAKERLSNEIIAQVLTQVVSNLEKTLRIHQGKIEKLTDTPLKIDVKELRQIQQSIHLKTNEIENVFAKNREVLIQSTTPLRQAKQILFYTGIIVFLLVGGMIIWLLFNNPINEEQKVKAQFLDEVFFSGTNAEKNKKVFEQWKIEKEIDKSEVIEKIR